MSDYGLMNLELEKDRIDRLAYEIDILYINDLSHEEPKTIPLRRFYRYVARILGKEDNSGDVAYSVGDVGLSFGSMLALSRKPDAWRLFYYIKEDYIRSWRTLSVAEGVSESISDSFSGFSIYQIISNDGTEWSELKGE